MARLKDDEYKQKQAAKKAAIPDVVAPDSVMANVPPQNLPAHPCPICRSAGREYGKRNGNTWYIRCTSCGHTWTERKLPGAVEITYRTTEIRTR